MLIDFSAEIAPEIDTTWRRNKHKVILTNLL